MSSAGTRFFNIAELADMVIELLNEQDTSALTRTNRHLFERYESLFYRNLRLDYKPLGLYLLDCHYATLALARNIHNVRELRISIVNLALLANCMLTHSHSIGTENQDPSPDTLASNHSATTTSSSSSHIVPVPPMANLERLETTLVRGSVTSICSYYDETDSNPKATLRHFSRLLDLSPRLTYIKAEWIPISNAAGLRLLSTSLSVLTCLETLILDEVVANDENWACIGRTLFNSCWPSVRVLYFKMNRPFYRKYSLILEAGWNEANQTLEDMEQASPAIRDRLQDLTMWTVTGSIESSEQELSFVLKRCPNLKRLTIPGTQSQPDYVISRFIQDHCLRLSSLAFVDWTYSPRVRAVVPIRVMMDIPVQRIEEFKWTGSLEQITLSRAQQMIQPHSQVLRKIVFERCSLVGSGAIKVILTECPALEHFRMGIENFKLIRGATITVLDAIADPWVCTKLKVLDLAVTLPDMPDLAPGQDPYYKRGAPTVELSDALMERLGELENLYYQIGLLTNLTHLALRAVILNIFSWREYLHDVTTPFPAMLNLKDEQTGRPGYLDHFRGLTQLEELRGSVNTNNEETEVTMGWEEARWMARCWPKLRVVAFAKDESELREPFVWLQRERHLTVDADPLFQW
ncbi:MAG: hypothetical protein JOS17DRAFT_746171 [Linnemannia elongata]|nr:MAG: hypothetical protein JOS17DRAFT_746171 [Linnemannia elongata]